MIITYSIFVKVMFKLYLSFVCCTCHGEKLLEIRMCFVGVFAILL